MLFLHIASPPLFTTHHLLRSWSSQKPLLAAPRRGRHREDIVKHLGVKTYLECLRGFERKHFDVFWRGLSPLAEPSLILCHTLRRRGLYRKPSAPTSCVVHEPLTLRPLPPARGSVSAQTTVDQSA
ncbi:hypothetical protein CgunFtcFv8_011275 [Champsocephalus gunnari]|uniref:Uncharacterized protein n=1 Tax=Champsocephalus gunnari TaxID=52237 RepID=A0AAN8D6I7_CHAGU|nr:hypothetical protein CgunFtcFv8_011275 [Champsocephalus gunnari]